MLVFLLVYVRSLTFSLPPQPLFIVVPPSHTCIYVVVVSPRPVSILFNYNFIALVLTLVIIPARLCVSLYYLSISGA